MKAFKNKRFRYEFIDVNKKIAAFQAFIRDVDNRLWTSGLIYVPLELCTREYLVKKLLREIASERLRRALK